MKSTREKLMEPLEHLLELGGTKKDITLLVLSGLAVVCSLAGIQPFPFDIAWVAIVLCGVPIILSHHRPGDRVRHQGGRTGVAGADRIGLHRRDLRRRRSGGHHAAGRPAGGADRCQGPRRHREAGAPDPADRPCAGESLPVDKTVGDEVSSGTVNQFGAFEMQASKVGEDSSIQRMIRLVQSADAGKAKIVGLADRWATWMPPTLPWWTMR